MKWLKKFLVWVFVIVICAGGLWGISTGDSFKTLYGLGIGIALFVMWTFFTTSITSYREKLRFNWWKEKFPRKTILHWIPLVAVATLSIFFVSDYSSWETWGAAVFGTIVAIAIFALDWPSKSFWAFYVFILLMFSNIVGYDLFGLRDVGAAMLCVNALGAFSLYVVKRNEASKTIVNLTLIGTGIGLATSFGISQMSNILPKGTETFSYIFLIFAGILALATIWHRINQIKKGEV